MGVADIGPRIGIKGEAEFRRSIANINAGLKTTAAEMKVVGAQFDNSDDKAAKYTAQLKVAERQQEQYRQKIKLASEALGHATATYGKNSTEAEKWRRVIQESKAELISLDNSINQMQTDLAAEERGIQSNTAALSDMEKALGSAALAGGALALAGLLRDCAEASIEFESAVTGVYKTVDGTDEQLATLAAGIKELATEIPASTTELSAVAEAAGQLGIARESVLDFTRTMTMLGTTTNMSAEEAATSLAQFANITHTAAENYSRLGSVIVALGNNFATTESKVTEMAQRLASAGTLAGLNEPQILALAAAMSSVGIEAEAGGTAMTQTLSAITKAVAEGGEKLQSFADVAGMSVHEFAKLWQTDAVNALQAFILGLGRLEEQGESSVMILDELGLSGVRQSNMLRSLALAGEQLSGAVDLANTAWVENTALTNEAALRYGTTESNLQLLHNATQRLAAAMGDALNPAINRFAKGAATATNATAELLENCPKLAQGLTATAAGAATFAAVLAGVGFKATDTGKKLSNFIAIIGKGGFANPTALAVGGVMALTAALVTLAATSKKTEREFAGMTTSIREAGKAYEETKQKIAEQNDNYSRLANTYAYLQQNADGSAASQKALADAQADLLAALPELEQYINAETGALEENWQQAVANAAAINEQTAALSRQAEISGQLVEVQATLAAKQAELQALETEGLRLGEEQSALYYKQHPLEAEKHELYKTLTADVSDLQRAESQLLAQQEEINASVAEFAPAAAEAESGADNLSGTIQNCVDKLSNFAKAYDETKAAARTSLDQQISGFEEMNTVFDTTAADLQKALDSQIKYLNDYADNLTLAYKKGVDEGLLQSLQDGSEKSAATLAALAAATDAEIAKINKSFKENTAAKDYLAGTIAWWQNDGDKILGEVEASMNDIAAALEATNDEYIQSGKNAIQGFIDGARSQQQNAEQTMAAIAASCFTAWRKQNQEHSPSRLYKSSGQNSIAGYMQGAEESAGAAKATMKNLAAGLYESFDSTASAAAAKSIRSAQTEADKAWKLAQSKYNDFASLRKALDNAYKSDLFTEETYYKKLRALRDKYLKPGDDDYDSITLELYSFDKERLAAETKSFLTDYEDTLNGVAETVKEDLAAINDRYDSVLAAQEALSSKLADYGSLYTSATLNYSDGSTGEYFKLADFEDQIAAFQEYQSIIDGLKNRGLANGLMNEVLNMGVDEAVKYGRELLKQGDSDWDKYNQQWEEKQRLAVEIANRYYKQEVSALENEYAATLRDGLQELNDISTDAGENVVGGLINGMKSQEDALRKEMRAITDAIEDELRSSLDMHSPSKRLEDLAKLAGEGLPKGFAPKLEEFRQMINESVPSNLMVNYQQQGSAERDGNIINALGTLLGNNAPSSGDLTIILRGGSDIEFARAVLPAFRRASAENPLVEVDF